MKGRRPGIVLGGTVTLKPEPGERRSPNPIHGGDSVLGETPGPNEGGRVSAVCQDHRAAQTTFLHSTGACTPFMMSTQGYTPRMR